MKYKLSLIALSLFLCSCSEPEDVVTGHARIITWPPQPVPAAPKAEIAAPVAKPQPQNPVATAPAVKPAPVSPPVVTPAPVAVPGAQYVVQHQQPAPVVAQNQPRIAPPPAPAPAVPQPQYVAPLPVSHPASVYASSSSPVAQQQPTTTTPPAVQWRTPQQRVQKRAYPTMPGQNRGLRNKNYTYY